MAWAVLQQAPEPRFTTAVNIKPACRAQNAVLFFIYIYGRRDKRQSVVQLVVGPAAEQLCSAAAAEGAARVVSARSGKKEASRAPTCVHGPVV